MYRDASNSVNNRELIKPFYNSTKERRVDCQVLRFEYEEGHTLTIIDDYWYIYLCEEIGYLGAVVIRGGE